MRKTRDGPMSAELT